jgi:hypothetical protein
LSPSSALNWSFILWAHPKSHHQDQGSIYPKSTVHTRSKNNSRHLPPSQRGGSLWETNALFFGEIQPSWLWLTVISLNSKPTFFAPTLTHPPQSLPLTVRTDISRTSLQCDASLTFLFSFTYFIQELSSDILNLWNRMIGFSKYLFFFRSLPNNNMRYLAFIMKTAIITKIKIKIVVYHN